MDPVKQQSEDRSCLIMSSVFMAHSEANKIDYIAAVRERWHVIPKISNLDRPDSKST